ncbi:UDP-glucosyltransferase 2-like isoform X1 [Diorhabda sublineata]|uniref:UDP-glucosyltransferase 2-like isoform X1 n=1 Tax=Diorhabda sublineata TaxID=1163346 RepID=UPI0024E12D27|nr:UDP-glucosyltransferase 2-like isoform X1 [Diorhabda sublineata]
MSTKVLLLFFLIIVSVSDINSAKILGIFAFFSPSHYFLGKELMVGLAENGNDVTMLTIFEEKNLPKNVKYRHITMEGVLEKQQELFKNFTSKVGSLSVLNKIFHPLDGILSEMVFNNPQMKQLIQSKEKFDVVIVPQFFMESPKALAAHFDAHLVLFNYHPVHSWMNHFVGNPSLPSLDTQLILGFPALMNFKQRLINTLVASLWYVKQVLIEYPAEAEIVRKYISKDIDLTQVQYNVSLVLSNSHISLNRATSSVPCMKEIAGFHIKPPKKLPDDLKKYLDESENGVIYFSMGTNLKSAELTEETRQSLMKAFAKRKENVLWKFESDDLPGKPDNVRIEKWLPQSDLLAHPNIKLFITHGGFLSTIETVYHGVPTVAIPVFADQKQNAESTVSAGFAKIVNFADISEQTISDAIDEVITNKKYTENAKYKSKIFHDRPMAPIQEAVYWIDYIVRYNGAPHLRVASAVLTWYQFYMLDVLLTVFLIIFVVIFILKTIFGFVYRKVCRSQSKSVQSSTKKIKRH